MEKRKRQKDPDYQVLSTGRWIVSPEAQKILDKLARKRERREAWIKKQKENERRKNVAQEQENG